MDARGIPRSRSPVLAQGREIFPRIEKLKGGTGTSALPDWPRRHRTRGRKLHHKATRRYDDKAPYGGFSGPEQAQNSAVERLRKARTFHINQATAWEVRKIIVRHVSRKSDLHTDEARIYSELGKEFDAHKTVIHSKYEYVRGNVHTNTVESVWSVFKRGMKGIYQHCGEAHLHRYLAEFDFRYNTELPPGVFVYALKREAADGEPLHQICTTCYEQRKKSILHRSDRINGLTQITCNGCGKTLEEGRFHVPQNVSDYNPYDN